jgi:hypothetical protein
VNTCRCVYVSMVLVPPPRGPKTDYLGGKPRPSTLPTTVSLRLHPRPTATILPHINFWFRPENAKPQPQKKLMMTLDRVNSSNTVP